MKIRIILILLVLQSSLVGCSHNVNQKGFLIGGSQNTKLAIKYFENEMSYTTNPSGTKAAIESDDIIIVDVRKEVDYKAGHIPGAINIPYDKWDRFQGNQKEFPGLRKDKIHYIYCYELLCNLSQKAAIKFASLSYPVKEIRGGFKAWKDHKYPIEK